MNYQGCVESIAAGKIVGWCIAPAAPHRPQFISVYNGDRLIGTARADVYRPDLLKFGGSGCHGFSFPIADHFADGIARMFSIFGGPGIKELSGSPIRVRLERLPRAPRPAAKSPNQYAPKRAAIVCWDLAHNPALRAHILYKLLEPDWNVELIGPIWQRFGADLCAPIRNEALRVKAFQPSDLLDVWREGAKIALYQSYDLVVICKPRLPGLVIGLQLAEQSRCPIVIDIDEDDRAFTGKRPRSGHASKRELLETPFSATGTDIAYQYLHVADALTVSNPAVQKRYPGRVVRHARDERIARADRQVARRHLGFVESDFVIAFIGTVRAHKGLFGVLSSLRKCPNASLKLLLAGSIPKEIEHQIKADGLDLQVTIHDEFDLSNIGTYLAAADLVPVLQDLDAEISKTQMPAKISDALQYGLPIVATDAPPFRDLAAKGVVETIKEEDFADYVAKIRALPRNKELEAHRRRVFEEELSFAVNRPRLELAVGEAFTQFDPNGTKVGTALRDLLAKTRAAQADVKGGTAKPEPQAEVKDKFDIAFFWKQNDSDLFGRRSDMVVKYLLTSERVGKIVHFDQRTTISDLRSWADPKRHSRDTAAMQLPRTVDRALRLADEERLERRIFIDLTDRSGAGSFGGQRFGGEKYPEYVERTLRDAGLDPAHTIAWVCPVVQGFAEVHQRLGFRKIIADLIDDERAWPRTDAERSALQEEYQATLQIADRVFTNCEGNRQRFTWARGDIIIIPNGAELHAGKPITVPDQLRVLPRPIIGYLGNLRDRIDWELVRVITDLNPSWSVVLAGPVEEDRLPDWVGQRSNLVLPGPVPYDESHSWISSFDVAIMPHLRSALTDAMNPLKLYNYLASAVPVVTTPVANIEELSDLVSIRDTPEAFAAAIAEILSTRRTPTPPDRLNTFSWDRRVKAMLDAIDGLC